MTEEVKDEVIEEPVEEVVETPQLSPAEEQAIKSGWLPKDEWEASGRNPDEWRSAKEFNERGELFRTMHQYKRELKQNQAALTALQKHHQFVFDQAYRKAKAELKKERREALRSEDFETVDQVEEQIEQLDSEYTQQKAELLNTPVQVQGPVEFDSWRERNAWYDTDEDLRDFADIKGLQYSRKHPGVPPSEVLAHVEEQVKKKFPEKLGLKRAAPNAVASVDRTATRTKSNDYKLSEDEEKICNDLVRGGVMTRAEYIKSLKEIKGE